MRVYAGMDPRLPLSEVPAHARRVERMGFDGLHVAETVHDSLAAALLACEHTERIVVRTAVTLAFPRSPMLTAYAAWDLAVLSGGRFQLGLGTQVRQHIRERFGMAWSEPVDRLREHLDVLAAAYTAFRTGDAPTYEGRHHRLTRLPPYFNPGPDEVTSPPPTYLGGVNERICRLAGARAVGFITHPTSSNPRYLEQLCRPALRAGAEGAGRQLEDLELVVGGPVITGADPDALTEERERQRRVLAFLYSTPAYRRTLELHGWDDLGGRLQQLVRDERWGDLPRLVTDEVLDALVPSATYDGLAEVLAARYGGLADGVLLHPPADPADDGEMAQVIRRLQEG